MTSSCFLVNFTDIAWCGMKMIGASIVGLYTLAASRLSYFLFVIFFRKSMLTLQHLLLCIPFSLVIPNWKFYHPCNYCFINRFDVRLIFHNMCPFTQLLIQIEKKFKAMVPFRLDGFIISSLSLKQRVGAYYNVINILSSLDQSK